MFLSYFLIGLWLCALFLRGRMGAPVKLRFQKMKLDLPRPVVCMLHYFWNFARNFLVFPGGHIQTKQKRFSPITLLKGTVMGYFLPISAYCYSFMFFYFLKTSTFSYPIWHRCSCYTLTVTKLKPIMKFSNLGCSGGHFGYVSLFLFLGKI